MKELSPKDFELAAAQAVVFTPDGELSTAVVLRDLLPRWGSHFDADPTLLPSVPGMPPEVPRALLQNRDGTLRCELAAGRAGFHFNRAVGAAPPSIQDAFEFLIRFACEYMEVSGRRVARLAALVSRLATHESPGLFLARHFCQERWLTKPLNRPENLELHAHKRFAMGEFAVNSWVRNKTGFLGTPTGTNEPIVIVEQDLNTLIEDAPTRRFSTADARQFYSLAVKEFDTILGLYYPAEGRLR